MFERILVPLDGSLHAEHAIPIAARIARVSGGSLLLVQVTDPFADPSCPFPNPLRDPKEVLETERASARAYLESSVASPILAGVNVTIHLAEGKPEHALLSVAQSIHADLIVMSHGSPTHLKHWVLSSVTQHIERHSSVPVLLLRDHVLPPEDPFHPEGQPTRVIVPLDGTALSEAILPAAVDLSRALSAPSRGHLHLMMVLPKIHFATAAVAGAYPQTIHDAQEYLTSVAQMLCQDALVRSSLEVTSSVVQQSTVNAALIELVTAEANSQASYKTSLDVIAMATHGREGLERWLHSSVTEQVLDAGTFPVLVLHPEPIEAHVPQDTERTDTDRSNLA